MRLTCPVCGMDSIRPVDPRFISFTVRCNGCDSSIGACALGGSVSVVYTEVPVEEWVTPP